MGTARGALTTTQARIRGRKTVIWRLGWPPSPPSRWFILCVAVLLNLLALAVLVRIGFHVLDCCEDPWFDRYLAVALAAMTGTAALGVWAVKHAFAGRGALGNPSDMAVAPPGMLDAKRLADDYLAVQHTVAQDLSISGLFGYHCGDKGRGQVQLAAVYVPLDVAEVDADQINDPEFRRLSFRRETALAVPMVKALADGIEKAPGGLRAVLVGEAGSGKSSAVGDLIHRCRQPESGADWPRDWPDALRRRTVVRFDLRQLGVWREDPPTGDGPTEPFWRALSDDLCRQLGKRERTLTRDRPDVLAAVDGLRDRLKGGGLLLLDGLDEVLDPEQRKRVRDLVLALVDELGSQCALLVTARPYVYPDAALEGFAVWRLQPLTVGAPGEPSQAQELADKWHRALGEDEAGSRALIADLASEPARADLATRPLLLTLLIALSLARRGHSQPLPTDRAGLLEAATTLFVQRWRERIEHPGPDQIEPDMRIALTRERLREVLQRLSLEAQEGRRDGAPMAGGDRGDVQIEILKSQFLGALASVLPAELPNHRVHAVGRYILERAALLFARGGTGLTARYGYVHRQFQEYLAACELVAPHPPNRATRRRQAWRKRSGKDCGRIRAPGASWRGSLSCGSPARRMGKSGSRTRRGRSAWCAPCSTVRQTPSWMTGAIRSRSPPGSHWKICKRHWLRRP